MTNPQTILKDTFGYDSFLPMQQEVIENVLQRRDTLAIMPTGGGKSLCYQIPALIFEGLTVVVSPLIALMKDQVEQLRMSGVPAVFLNSTLGHMEYEHNMRMIRSGKVSILYMAPETLMTPRIFTLLDEVKVELFTIDEAHCISEWGHDFRPEYRQMAAVRQRYPQAVCLALTATATPHVREDIQRSLNFSKKNEFVASFNRKNLMIDVLPKHDARGQLMDFLQSYKDQSGIIYCFSRRQVDDLSETLSSEGFSVRPYHAGLENEVRKANQEAFIHDDVQIIVATVAFGMGINKPNVRFVVHYDLPKSIEGYYQEIGRAGRDGLPAHCLLLYTFGDAQKIRYFFREKSDNERQAAESQLQALIDYADNTSECRRIPLLNYFGEKFPPSDEDAQHSSDNGKVYNCGNCDNCFRKPAKAEDLTDITVPAQKFLSCVMRTGQYFGASHIASVLRGSKKQKVLKLKHDQLSTYGIGREFNNKQWQTLGQQLVRSGYLNRNTHTQVLSLTDKAMTSLRERQPIRGRLEEINLQSRRYKAQSILNPNSELFQLLRDKRKELADKLNVPPYVIFPDTTLNEMAHYYPHSMQSLLAISGVGLVKQREYGQAFLDVIHPFCAQHQLKEIPKENRRKYAPAGAGGRTIRVGKRYNNGESVDEITKSFDFRKETIIDHLYKYVLAGNQLREGDDLRDILSLPEPTRQVVFAAFDELGTSRLKPIFEHMNERVPYDSLKVLRFLYMVKKNNEADKTQLEPVKQNMSDI